MEYTEGVRSRRPKGWSNRAVNFDDKGITFAETTKSEGVLILQKHL